MIEVQIPTRLYMVENGKVSKVLPLISVGVEISESSEMQLIGSILHNECGYRLPFYTSTPFTTLKEVMTELRKINTLVRRVNQFKICCGMESGEGACRWRAYSVVSGPSSDSVRALSSGSDMFSSLHGESLSFEDIFQV